MILTNLYRVTMKLANCGICQSVLIDSGGIERGVGFNCPRCGIFSITTQAIDDVVMDKKRFTAPVISNLSGWIREHQRELIDSNRLNKLMELKAPDVHEKSYKLLKWLNQETEYPSKSVLIDTSNNSALLAICWVYNQQELIYLINHLFEMGHVTKIPGNGNISLGITPRGFSYLEEFNKNSNSNLGFCAMWFDEQLNSVWEQAIEPAIKKAGYDAKRIDKHPHNQGIVDEIVALIRRSKFIVADLTGHRNGVYFEAGFAKGLGLEVIFTCKKDDFKDVHFDLQHFNFLWWEEDKLEDFQINLAWRIEQTLGYGSHALS